MKTRHLMMALVLLLIVSNGWGQNLRGIRKVADKQRRELKLQHRIAPKAAQRIQPAAAEKYVSENQASPSAYYKYDAWGNEMENTSDGKDYYIQTWDNSHGYPVLLDRYYYRKGPDGSMNDLYYDQRTTLNESGIRIALEDDDFEQITLDASGHVLYAKAYGSDDELLSFEYTWNGELLSSYKYDYDSYDSYGNDEEHEHINITNIEAVYQTKPFNAYGLDYYESVFDPEYGGLLINATGTCSSLYGDESVSGSLQITSEVSADKKNLVMTTTVGGKLFSKATIIYTDENGSYTSRMEYAEGDYEQHNYTYNEYGDLINMIESEGTVDYTGEASENRYEWEYDNGKPLQVKNYFKYGDTEEYLASTLIFTEWHLGSSISTTTADIATILGATLYTLEGVKVHTLTAEEAQNAEAITAPQSGIYLLVIQTDRGMETRKVVL